PDSPRAMEAQDLAREIEALRATWQGVASGLNSERLPILVESDIPRAVNLALGMAGGDDIVLVTGSFYLVGHARTWLRTNMNVPKFHEYTLNDRARM
ncbi:MAG TPA: hypothetical protein GX507_08670, partial [Clostridia bacterium]|nr:hypothetical protein [Clostridia bacterium]